MRKSTLWLASGSKAGKGAEVYAIDPHQGYVGTDCRREKDTFLSFQKNIQRAELDEIVVPLRLTSEEAAKNWKREVELVFIDGDHAEEMVSVDFNLWAWKLIEGGFIAFHDSFERGPRKVIYEHLCLGNHFKDLQLVDSTVWARKTEKLSTKDKLYNYVFLLFWQSYIYLRQIPFSNSFRRKAKSFAARLMRGTPLK